uniref:Nucleoside-diphosphate kinase n=1 Tax=Pelusios castaneus TaxID=367368 RepID=A0A8C8VG37_9SAUR
MLAFVESQPRSAAPFTPRILLCGPPGSGKSLQAALLAQKYGVVNVGCGQLLKEAVAEKSKVGELIKPYFESGCPVADNLVLKLLRERLDRLDCTSFGWVLHGFPRDADQAELLQNADPFFFLFRGAPSPRASSPDRASLALPSSLGRRTWLVAVFCRA